MRASASSPAASGRSGSSAAGSRPASGRRSAPRPARSQRRTGRLGRARPSFDPNPANLRRGSKNDGHVSRVRVCVSGRIGYSSERTPGCDADVAQLVEHHLAKVRVAGSNPVVRSEGTGCPCGIPFVAEWPSGLGKGLQSPVHGFDSRLRLPGRLSGRRRSSPRRDDEDRVGSAPGPAGPNPGRGDIRVPSGRRPYDHRDFGPSLAAQHDGHVPRVRVCASGRIGYSSERTPRVRRGRGSVGRASPCQGEGRGFESRRPL